MVLVKMADRFTFPWEQAAMRGDEMPDGLPLPDQMAYTAMRNIYDAYHKKTINRDTAAAEKRKVRKEYEQSVKEVNFQKKLAYFRSELSRKTEIASTDFRKNPTIEGAIRIVKIVDGIVSEWALKSI